MIQHLVGDEQRFLDTTFYKGVIYEGSRLVLTRAVTNVSLRILFNLQIHFSADQIIVLPIKHEKKTGKKKRPSQSSEAKCDVFKCLANSSEQKEIIFIKTSSEETHLRSWNHQKFVLFDKSLNSINCFCSSSCS